MKLPSLNKDWIIMGGTAILAITGAIYLHNRFAGIVPTVPGIRYGPGGPATGIYTGQGPYTPEPIAQDIYGTVRGVTGPVTSEAIGIGRQGIGTVQSMIGYTGGDVGRGNFRDRWTDVYDSRKTGAMLTRDDPDRRVSLA